MEEQHPYLAQKLRELTSLDPDREYVEREENRAAIRSVIRTMNDHICEATGGRLTVELTSGECLVLLVKHERRVTRSPRFLWWGGQEKVDDISTIIGRLILQPNAKTWFPMMVVAHTNVVGMPARGLPDFEISVCCFLDRFKGIIREKTIPRAISVATDLSRIRNRLAEEFPLP